MNFRCSSPASQVNPIRQPLSWNAAGTMPLPVKISPMTGMSCCSMLVVRPSIAVVNAMFAVPGLGIVSSGISFCNRSFIMPSSSMVNTPSPYLGSSSSSSCVLVMYIRCSHPGENCSSYSAARALDSCRLLPRLNSISFRMPVCLSSPGVSYRLLIFATIVSSTSARASGTSVPSLGTLLFHNSCNCCLMS